MAHYAFIDENNIVTEVIVGRGEDEVVDGISDWEAYYADVRGQRCLRTSYNTKAGQHSNGGTPFRGNYAGVGYVYDEALDAFIPPQPYPSWVLNGETFLWEAPIPYPSDGKDYIWDESAVAWVEVEDEAV
jgi:hypothetical protein